MTQTDAKAAIDRTFAAQIEKLFGVFVINLETQAEPQAKTEFRKGFSFSIRAHALAIEIAGNIEGLGR